MRRVYRAALICLLIAVGVVSCGCGESRPEFVSTTTTGGNQFLGGKLFLGADIAGVPVTLESLDGQVLGSSVTDSTGNFAFTTALPADFRVVATISPDLEFSREIRDFGTAPTYASITIPTTLVSRLAQSDPSADLADLENVVRQGLQLSSDDAIAKLDESVGERFSHLDFFRHAVLAGGLDSYLAQQASSPGSDAPYLLRSESLEFSLSTLPPEIASPLGRFQADPRTRRSTQRLLSRSLSEPARLAERTSSRAVASPVLAQFGEVAVADVALDLLEDVGEDTVEAIIGDEEGDEGGGNDGRRHLRHTWSSQQLAGHFGIADELEAISAQLSDIATELNTVISDLNSLINEIAIAELQAEKNNFLDALAEADDYRENIEGVQTQLIDSIVEATGTNGYFSDTPSTLPPNVVNIVSLFSSTATFNSLVEDVTELQAALTGADPNAPPSNPNQILFPPVVVNLSSTGSLPSNNPNLVLALRNLVFDSLGISVSENTERFSNFPVRSSALLDSILGPFEGYGQAQILGSNLISEAAHQSANPGEDIQRARTYADNVARSLINTRAQVPAYPLSDNYFLDLENGLQWYTVVQAPADVDTILNSALAFDDGETTGWHAPSYDELRSLMLRAGWAAGDGQSYDFANAVEGLQKLGFDTSALGSSEQIGFPFYNWNYTGPAWFAQNFGLIAQMPVTGDYTNSATTYTGADAFYTELPWLMCRTLGTQPTLDISASTNPDYAVPMNPGTWPDGFEGSPIPAELPSVASVTGLTQLNVPNNVVTFSSEYTLYTGASSASGGYMIGTDSFQTTYTPTPFMATTADYLPPVYFQTNDDDGTAVSNYASTYGAVINRVNSNEVTTIVLNTLGYSTSTGYPSAITASVPFNTVGPETVTLDQIQIMPRNVAMANPGTTGTNVITQQFVAVGFYSDQTVQDLTSSATWSVVDTDTGVAPVGAVISSTGNLETTNVPNASENLEVRVSITQTGNPSGTSSDSTLVLVSH